MPELLKKKLVEAHVGKTTLVSLSVFRIVQISLAEIKKKKKEETSIPSMTHIPSMENFSSND